MSIDTDRLSSLAARAHRAPHKPPTAPTYVYLLAEHLDAALAAGEDLLAKSFTWNTANPETEGAADAERAAMRQTFRQIQNLEILIVARVLRAREHAITLEKKDTNFRNMAGLFVSSVTVLMDAVSELKDPLFQRFETGDALTAYMRSRGILDDETPAPIDCSIVDIPGHFLIARRIELGALMDLLAMFLDALEIRFDIFAPDDDAEYAEDERLSALTVHSDMLAAIRRAVAEPMPQFDADAARLSLALPAEPAPVATFGLRVKDESEDREATASPPVMTAAVSDAAAPEGAIETAAVELQPAATVADEPASDIASDPETAVSSDEPEVVASVAAVASTDTQASEAAASPSEAELEAGTAADAQADTEPSLVASSAETAVSPETPEANTEADAPLSDATAQKEAIEYESLLARLNAIVGPESESVTKKPPKLPPSPTVDDTLKTIALVGKIFSQPLEDAEAPPEVTEVTIGDVPSDVPLAEATLEPPATPEPSAIPGEPIDAEYEDVVCAS